MGNLVLMIQQFDQSNRIGYFWNISKSATYIVMVGLVPVAYSLWHSIHPAVNCTRNSERLST